MRYFPKGFKFDLSTELPITKGKIHFVRLVNENVANGVRGDALLAELQKEESYHTLTQLLNLVKEIYGVYDKALIADALTGIIIASTRNEGIGMNISLHSSFTNILQTGNHLTRSNPPVPNGTFGRGSQKKTRYKKQ